MKNILFLIFLFIVFFAKSSFALIEIDITRGNLTPLPVAVSPLHVESKSSDFNFSLILTNKFSLYGKPKGILQQPNI